MTKLFFIILVSLVQLKADEYASLLFHGNCTTCHFELETHSAPSIVDLKQRYLSAFAQKKLFVQQMSTWVLQPKKENSIMHDAIQKYGLMPELGFDLETLEIIAEYIYETDFTQKHETHNKSR